MSTEGVAKTAKHEAPTFVSVRRGRRRPAWKKKTKKLQSVFFTTKERTRWPAGGGAEHYARTRTQARKGFFRKAFFTDDNLERVDGIRVQSKRFLPFILFISLTFAKLSARLKAR